MPLEETELSREPLESHVHKSRPFDGNQFSSSGESFSTASYTVRILIYAFAFRAQLTYGQRLYRRILRAHRFLPAEMRSLGDDYVKSGNCCKTKLVIVQVVLISSEFRRHRSATNHAHIMGFLTQWKVYLDQLPCGPEGENFSGKKLDPTVFEKVGMSMKLRCA
jgi:hypothetical protein